MRLLLVSFYFPPAGGGGVQRPLKMAEQLPGFGIEVFVLAPGDPRWIHRDLSLAEPRFAQVQRAPYLGPRGRLPAQELYGRVGLDRAVHLARLAPRRLLVPDENVSWALTALPAALRLVRRERIDVVLTTSPPSSVHLLGAALKRLTGVAWVADLRDSLVAKEDRAVERRLARAKERAGLGVARLVAGSADLVVAVTGTFAAQMRELNPGVRVGVVPNGVDFEEFEGLAYLPGERLRVTHTGSFFGKRDPRPFLSALAQASPDIVGRFVGDFRPADREWARGLGLGERLEVRPFTPRRETLALQRDSEVLLLLLPEIGERGLDVPSGKLYEYLAARRPILAVVPPAGAAARLVEEAGAGVVVAPDDVGAIGAALAGLHARWRAGGLADVELAPGLRERLSREARNRDLANLLHSAFGSPDPAGLDATEP